MDENKKKMEKALQEVDELKKEWEVELRNFLHKTWQQSTQRDETLTDEDKYKEFFEFAAKVAKEIGEEWKGDRGKGEDVIIEEASDEDEKKKGGDKKLNEENAGKESVLEIYGGPYNEMENKGAIQPPQAQECVYSAGAYQAKMRQTSTWSPGRYEISSAEPGNASEYDPVSNWSYTLTELPPQVPTTPISYVSGGGNQRFRMPIRRNWPSSYSEPRPAFRYCPRPPGGQGYRPSYNRYYAPYNRYQNRCLPPRNFRGYNYDPML